MEDTNTILDEPNKAPPSGDVNKIITALWAAAIGIIAFVLSRSDDSRSDTDVLYRLGSVAGIFFFAFIIYFIVTRVFKARRTRLLYLIICTVVFFLTMVGRFSRH